MLASGRHDYGLAGSHRYSFLQGPPSLDATRHRVIVTLSTGYRPLTWAPASAGSRAATLCFGP